MIIQFSPGSTILISLTALMHGNCAISPGESRVFFTRYAAGGLFRWIRYRFRSWETLKAGDQKLAEKEEGSQSTQWKTAIQLFSCVHKLHVNIIAVGLVVPRSEVTY